MLTVLDCRVSTMTMPSAHAFGYILIFTYLPTTYIIAALTRHLGRKGKQLLEALVCLQRRFCVAPIDSLCPRPRAVLARRSYRTRSQPNDTFVDEKCWKVLWFCFLCSRYNIGEDRKSSTRLSSQTKNGGQGISNDQSLLIVLSEQPRWDLDGGVERVLSLLQPTPAQEKLPLLV